MHPGHTVEEVIENTGFDFDQPASVPETPAPSPETLKLMREVVAPQLAEVYPQFAAQVFGVGKPLSTRLKIHRLRSRSLRGRDARVASCPRGRPAAANQCKNTRNTSGETVEAAVIGVGWVGGTRAETLSRTALVDKLHLCEIRPDRLAEVKALYKPATATLDYQDIINNRRTFRWSTSRPRRKPTTIRSAATA